MMNALRWKYFPSCLLWTLSLISIFMMFKASDDPTAHCLSEPFIEKLLLQFSTGNLIVFNLATGFLISVIFYLIIVYLPKKRNAKILKPIVSKRCEAIIFSLNSLIHDVLINSDTKPKYRSLTKEILEKVCKEVKPKSIIKSFHNGPANIFKHHLGYSIYNKWNRVIQECNHLIPMYSYMDSGIISNINKVMHFNEAALLIDLKDLEHLKNEDLSAWSSTLWHIYELTKEFRNYYVNYSGSAFKNDPF